jgi:hypothetical protein
MSDSAAPEPRIPGSEFDILIESTRTTYEDWLERLVTNGPDGLTATNQLRTLKRGYVN